MKLKKSQSLGIYRKIRVGLDEDLQMMRSEEILNHQKNSKIEVEDREETCIDETT